MGIEGCRVITEERNELLIILKEKEIAEETMCNQLKEIKLKLEEQSVAKVTLLERLESVNVENDQKLLSFSSEVSKLKEALDLKKTDHEELLVKHEVIRKELEKLKCVEIRLEEISQDNIKLTELKLDLDAKIERYCNDYMFSILLHLTFSFHFLFLNYSISLCIVVT